MKRTNKTSKHLALFTHREDSLMARAKAQGLRLPDRLSNWRFWIMDSEIYLNELKNLVESAERRGRI